LISWNSSILSDITGTTSTTTASPGENLALDSLSEKTPGDGNDATLSTEEEQLLIVDSISCSTDRNDLDPEGSNIFNELLEGE